MLLVFGFNVVLVLFWFVGQNGVMDVMLLICVDGYVMFYIGLVLLVSFVICIFVYLWFEGYKDNKEEFYLLVLIVVLGGILLVGVNYLVVLFFGIELILLLLFGLVGYVFCQKCLLEVSIKYIIFFVVVLFFLLFGMVLVYVNFGNLFFFVLGKSLVDNMLYELLLLVGFGLMIVGFGFKLLLVLFYLWMLDVYQGVFVLVFIFLVIVSKIVIFGVVMCLFLYMLVGNSEVVCVVLGLIVFVFIIFGNLMVLSQINIKCLFGYFFIFYFGYLLVVLIVLQSGEMLMEVVGVYLVGYLFSSFGVFGVVSLMFSLYCGLDVDLLFFYCGLFWYCLILLVVMMVMMFFLVGILMIFGFIGKFYVLVVGVYVYLWWLVVVVVVGLVIGFYYYLCVVVSLYLSVLEQLNCDVLLNWQYSVGGIVVLIFVLLVLVFGIWLQLLISIVQLVMLLM